MHTKPSPAAAVWAAVRAIHWSNPVAVIAVLVLAYLAGYESNGIRGGVTYAGVGAIVVLLAYLVVQFRDQLLAAAAHLPGRAGALFRDPGGPAAVERFRDTVDALDLHMADEPEAGDWDAWDIGLQRLTDARDAAAQHVSPARRLMGW